jgi:hypothetical protein
MAHEPRRKPSFNKSGCNNNTGVDWRITLIVKQWGVRERVGFSWLRIETSCGLCEHTYEYSGFIKRRGFSQPAERLSASQLDFAAWIFFRLWRKDDISRKNTRLLRNTSSIIVTFLCIPYVVLCQDKWMKV